MNNITSGNMHVIEQISAYLDGALDDAVSDDVQAHIDSCTLCRAEYTEVRATRQLLRSAPTISPPRAFTLTEEMVARRSWSWGRLLVPRNVPRLMTGSAMAFALVLFLFVANLSSFGTSANLASRSIAEKQVLGPPQAQGSLSPTTGTAADSAISGGDQQPEGTALPLMSMPTGVANSAQNPVPEQSTPAPVGSGGSYAEPTPQALPTIGVAAGALEAIQTPTTDAYRYLLFGTPALNEGQTQTGTRDGDFFSSPAPAPAPDGGRLLLISVEGLLVVLGALFAVGAVFASRR